MIGLTSQMNSAKLHCELWIGFKKKLTLMWPLWILADTCHFVRAPAIFLGVLFLIGEIGPVSKTDKLISQLLIKNGGETEERR